MKKVLILSLLVVSLDGYAHAPGTYPENEMSDSSDMEVPKNPYQSGWTGYEYYYEKEPKKMPGSGQMPAFQSIESSSSDRESPDDPSGYQASGSESGPKSTNAPTTLAPPPPTTTTEAPAQKIEVAPSSTTGIVPSTTPSTTTITTTPPVVSTNAISPDTGTDLSAAGELYGEMKDEYSAPAPPSPPSPPSPSPPAPKNLLTTIMEKKADDSYEDHLGGPSGYEMAPESSKKIIKMDGSAPVSRPMAPKASVPFDYGQTNGNSEYEAHGDGAPTNQNAPTMVPKTIPKIMSKPGSAPGAQPVQPAPGSSNEKHEPSNNYDSNGNDRKDATSSETEKTIGTAPGTEYLPDAPKPTVTAGPDYGQESSEAPTNHYDASTVTSLPDDPHNNSQTAKDYEDSHQKSAPDSTNHEAQSPTSTSTNDRPENAPKNAPNIGEQPGYEDESSATMTSSSRAPEQQNYDQKHGSFAPGAAPKLTEPYSGGQDYSSTSGDYKPSDKLGGWEDQKSSESTNNKVVDRSGDAYSGTSGGFGKSEGSNSKQNAQDPESSEDISTQETYLQPSSKFDGYDAPELRTPPTPYPPYSSIPTIPFSGNATGAYPEPKLSNSNNAITARDPYDHFGTAPAPNHLPRVNHHKNHHAHHSDFEDESDGGYGDVDSDRSTHSTTTITGNDIRAQISEIDRIAESFENSAREPVEYEHKITSESSKGITVEAGKDIKHLGRKSRKCCSCCDEKQPVTRNIETKVEPAVTQHLTNPQSQPAAQEPVQQFVPLESTVGGNAYVQQPVQQPKSHYQQPFQQYQPQYPQSYPYQQPSCGCQPQPQNCCAPPQPCCMPTIPCCPPIPCCPQPKICCQPQPVCTPPPTCCSINFQLPTIPICGRACPSCPCRRRVHKSRRLKRHALSTNCNRCSSAGEPWKIRQKRAAGCASGYSTVQQNSCSTCGASHLRSTRVKRMGCLPCLGRKKRDTEENSHIRVKRMGCLPCLGRKKRSALSSGCSQCNSLGHLFNRYKRSLFGCSPCAPPQPCGCQGRKKRSVSLKVYKRAPAKKNQCDASCCDYSRCPNRQKKDTLVPFM